MNARSAPSTVEIAPDEHRAKAEPPVLAVSGLTTSYRVDGIWRTLVSGVDVEIGRRETVAVVGESGSGKSITALSIMRLLPRGSSRIEGSVRLMGRELLEVPDKDMCRIRGNEIGMIFQEPLTSLNPMISVGFQIAEVLLEHRGLARSDARLEAIRLMEKVRIPDAAARLHHYPHQFSGGMRQRVMIAMALACRPKLLIADEPTTALDVTIQAQVLDLIKALQEEEGMSVLFITHDMGVVAEIADRVVVMRHGKVVETGDAHDIFYAPRHPYTRALRLAVPALGEMADEVQPVRFPVVNMTTGAIEVGARAVGAAPQDSKPVLEVRNLCARFDVRTGLLGGLTGRVHALENVSFDLHRRETLGLVGESGCGKTTTGRVIVRLINPSSGTVLIDDIDALAQKGRHLRELRKKVQMVFQDPFASLNPRLSIGAAVAEPLVANGVSGAEAASRVADLLVKVGLRPEMMNRFPHEFSGGQRQRACVARALALEPKIIIADEAVSALDASIRAQVVNLMLDLQESLGIAFLFISHDMAVVERICHRVAVMYLGEIVEIGPRQAVFGDPQHPYTRRLLSAVPVPDVARRRPRAALRNDEIRSPIRPVDYDPPVRIHREVSPGHYVQTWTGEWDL